ncbi:TM2 domain-containing protein, partial [Streptococcus uberis]
MEAKVNKKTYILLAVFLGMFGAHEFYAKKVKSGLLYLIFCWTAVPFLLGLYDAIKASTIAKDENGKISISDKQNKLIPIAIATALVVSSVFFAPKSKPETTKKEPVKTVQKTKKAPELKKASDEKKYDKKANEQFA